MRIITSSGNFLAKIIVGEVIKPGFVVLNRSLIGWKKAREGVIIKLLVPAGAIVHLPYEKLGAQKYRASEALVLTMAGVGRDGYARSLHDYSFTYRRGVYLTPRYGMLQRHEDCGGGIHFFLNREEAASW